MKLLLALVFLAISQIGIAKEDKKNYSSIRVVPVSRTPEPDNVETLLIFPKEGQICSPSIDLQIRLSGYPLGILSAFDRKTEIYNDENGQSMRVLIDNFPYLSIYRSFIDSLDQNKAYFDQTLTQTVSFNLKSGVHLIRAFPVRSYGEGLKGSRAFTASTFYTGESAECFDLNAPFLTYNMPQGQIPYCHNQPILLDFYVSNAYLSRDGYKIQLTIDGKVERMLTDWVPYYIYGLMPGNHTIRLELFDSQNQKVPGMLNDVQKRVTLY